MHNPPRPAVRDPDDIMAEMVSARPMPATYVIARLQQLVADHGDLPVILADRDVYLREIVAYDAEGNSAGPRVEFGLHGW